MEATPLEQVVDPALALKCTGEDTVDPLEGAVTLIPASADAPKAIGHTNRSMLRNIDKLSRIQVFAI